MRGAGLDRLDQRGSLDQRVLRRAAAAALLGVAASILFGVGPANADYIRDREYWLSTYGISEAWKVTRGAGVTIAIIDTGVDGSHPDLQGAVVGGTDVSGIGSASGQQPVGNASSRGHGTMVASLAAGRGHGTAGVLGAAPEASVLSVSIGFGSSVVNSDDQVADAVRWAVDNGADVINMSLTRSTLDWPESWDEAFLYAADHEVVVVAAAGNRGSGNKVVGAPATIPGVLTVAGVDRNGVASLDASAQGITIGVAAPSENLVGAIPGSGYALWDGTSGAAPLVAGVAALVMAAHPDLDAVNVVNRIVGTATPAGAEGVDAIYGFGLLNAAAAVSNDVASVEANPMGDLEEWVTLYRRADAEPIPAATGAEIPDYMATPIAVGGEVKSSTEMFRETWAPLALYLGFALALGVLVFGALRHFRALRRAR